MHNPITDVAIDFPPECAALYPDGFKYPVGYLAPSNRVVDPSVVEPFNPLLRPYVVRNRKGEPMVDPHAPVAVRRLLRDQDSNLLSAIRFLELGGPPDPSMQETYSCEDRLSQAETLSEAGHHASAISMVRALPAPFQQTASALRTLSGSLKALGVYEEGLIEVKRLILNEEITEYARDLARIEEANLLVLLGRCSDAEEIIRDGRATFRSFYTYYGVRAVLALLAGDELFARQLIARAGRIEDYHSFKLLWEPALRPLWAFIRHEFLDEENQPLLYRLNSETRRTSHRVQGALLTNDRIAAGMLMEGVMLSRITDWSTAYEAVLCLCGLGEFELIDAVCGFLPGSRHAALKLARAVAQNRLTLGSHSAEELERLFEEAGSSARNRDHFNKLAAGLSDGQKDDLPDPVETLLADIGDKWGAQGRERFRVVHVRDEGYSAVGFMEDRKRLDKSHDDPHDHFAPTQTLHFSSADETEEWLEQKLRANEDLPKDGFCRRRWDIHFNGWGCLTKLRPTSERTPLLAEAWNLMCSDPNLYFSNGPASSFALHIGFGDRLAQMLIVTLRSK